MESLFAPWRYAYLVQESSRSECVFCDALLDEADTADKRLIVYRARHNFVILNLNDSYFDAITNDDGFVFFAWNDQHGSLLRMTWMIAAADYPSVPSKKCLLPSANRVKITQCKQKGPHAHTPLT